MGLLGGCSDECKEEKAFLRERLVQLEQMLFARGGPTQTAAYRSMGKDIKETPLPDGFMPADEGDGFISHNPMEIPGYGDKRPAREIDEDFDGAPPGIGAVMRAMESAENEPDEQA